MERSELEVAKEEIVAVKAKLTEAEKARFPIDYIYNINFFSYFLYSFI
jgi:hypothetical protein